MSEIHKKENENFLDYAERLIDSKERNLIDIDKSELWEILFGEKLSPDESRKRLYAIKKMIEELRKDNYCSVSEESMKKQLEQKRQDLQKEKVKVQTEKQSLSQLLREQARFELFIERTVEAIKNYKPIECKHTKKIKPVSQGRTGVLLFSDTHYAKEFEIKDLEGNILNKYDIEIFEKRMWNLFDETLDIIEKEKFDNICVMSLGDELEGMIRLGQLMSLKKGLVESTIDYTYFIANWLNELSKYVYIDFYSTEGNHTDARLISGNKGDFPHENLSRIIQVLLKEILKENNNIKIHDNKNEDKIFTNIEGFNILGIHGEEKDVTKAIKDFSFMYDTRIDYIMTGHKHHKNSANIGVNKGCIGVGSVMGLDDYAIKIKKVANPTGSFVIFEKDVGKTLEYTLYL